MLIYSALQLKVTHTWRLHDVINWYYILVYMEHLSVFSGSGLFRKTVSLDTYFVEYCDLGLLQYCIRL
jgi:hypothetical protein